MGKLEETMEAYFGQSSADDLQEKVILEKDKMSLPHALIILHKFCDRNIFGQNVEEAFQVVFEWIDNMAILLKKSGGIDESNGNKTE